MSFHRGKAWGNHEKNLSSERGTPLLPRTPFVHFQGGPRWAPYTGAADKPVAYCCMVAWRRDLNALKGQMVPVVTAGWVFLYADFLLLIPWDGSWVDFFYLVRAAFLRPMDVRAGGKQFDLRHPFLSEFKGHNSEASEHMYDYVP